MGNLVGSQYLCEFEQITSFSSVFLPHLFIKLLKYVICTIFFTQTSCHLIANSVRNQVYICGKIYNKLKSQCSTVEIPEVLAQIILFQDFGATLLSV